MTTKYYNDIATVSLTDTIPYPKEDPVRVNIHGWEVISTKAFKSAYIGKFITFGGYTFYIDDYFPLDYRIKLSNPLKWSELEDGGFTYHLDGFTTPVTASVHGL